MAKLVDNNAKNMSTSHTLFKLNCGYYLCISYKKDIDLRSKSKSVKELSTKLGKLIIICQENLYYAQKIGKQAYDKVIKPRSYISNNKI